jgi:hypothetical protein
MADGDLSLLVPEWQGCGAVSAVGAGARSLAAQYGSNAFTTIEAPDHEVLTTDDGVIDYRRSQRARGNAGGDRGPAPSRIHHRCADRNSRPVYLARRC